MSEPVTMSAAAKSDAREDAVWAVLANVLDPEIPVLSVVELGIVRYVHWAPDGRLHVGLSPTYSGCPATDVIRRAVGDALNAAGFHGAVLEEVLSPPWTSDWLTDSGRRKLESFGIAPPPMERSARESTAGPAGWSVRESLAGQTERPARESPSGARPMTNPRHLFRAPVVIRCPRCGSADTERVSEFGSTPCKAHYRCVSCLEPFDHFKCI